MAKPHDAAWGWFATIATAERKTCDHVITAFYPHRQHFVNDKAFFRKVDGGFEESGEGEFSEPLVCGLNPSHKPGHQDLPAAGGASMAAGM